MNAEDASRIGLNGEDEAHLHVIIREETEAARLRMCERVHALVIRAAVNGEYKEAFERLSVESTALRAEIATLTQEKAALSAHLEAVATERDGLRARVFDLEARLKGGFDVATTTD